MTKASELREMSDEQLALTLKDAAEHLFRLRLQAQTERLDAPSELRKQRRLIARVRTIQTQRAIKTAGGVAAPTGGGVATASVAAPKSTSGASAKLAATKRGADSTDSAAGKPAAQKKDNS